MFTIQSAYQEFVLDNTRKNLSPETLRYYRENLSRFIKWLDGEGVRKANKITEKLVNDYFLFLIRTVSNRISVNTYMRAVRRFVNYLSERNIIKPISIAPIKDYFTIKPTFDADETERILNSVDAHDETSVIMLLLLACGIRSRSLRELQVCDVHISDCYIDVKRTKNRAPLCLPISENIAEVLKQYISIHARRDLLFPNSHGCAFDRCTLGRRVNTRLRQLGIPAHKSGVHIFRHTFGKIMSMNSCPTAVLQKWFGHSDIRITQRYVDLYGNELKNTMSMLPTSHFQYV